MPRPYFGNTRPLAFAHRGGAAVWPENTEFAFSKAAALGYRYIETDVHLTADGQLVLFHDDTLERTTNGHGRLRAHTLAELQNLNAAHAWPTYRNEQLRIPTLEEALALDPPLRLNLEIKPNCLRTVNALWERIDYHAVHDRVLVASAHDDAVRAFRRVSRGKVATSAGRREILQFWFRCKTGTSRFASIAYDALQVPPRHGRLKVLSERFVHAAHHHGLHVHAWTINDGAEMARLVARGVDGIMTDQPETLLAVLGR